MKLITLTVKKISYNHRTYVAYLQDDGYDLTAIDKSIEEYFISWFHEYVRSQLI